MMEQISALIALGMIVIFGFLVYRMVISSNREKEHKAQKAYLLGFSADEPSQDLLDWIFSVYPEQENTTRYVIKNVYRKVMLNGEMVIFDLIDTGGDEDSYLENQAVAVISPELDLPKFVLHPQVDMPGWASQMANRLMRKVVGRYGELVEFPESPDFQKKYLLTSDEPERIRSFFQPQLLNQLAQTSLLGIRARGNVFTLSSLDPTQNSANEQAIIQRIDQAMQVFLILRQGAND